MSTDSSLQEAQETESKLRVDDITPQEDTLDSRVQAIRKNPWAFAWCVFTVWTLLVATYEDQASYAVLGIPEFRKDFGSYYKGGYVLAAEWQSAFTGGPIAVYVPIAQCLSMSKECSDTFAVALLARLQLLHSQTLSEGAMP